MKGFCFVPLSVFPSQLGQNFRQFWTGGRKGGLLKNVQGKILRAILADKLYIEKCKRLLRDTLYIK